VGVEFDRITAPAAVFVATGSKCVWSLLLADEDVPADAVPSAEGVASESDAEMTPAPDTARPVPTLTDPAVVEVAS
jgi:hypothetical protein